MLALMLLAEFVSLFAYTDDEEDETGEILVGGAGDDGERVESDEGTFNDENGL